MQIEGLIRKLLDYKKAQATAVQAAAGAEALQAAETASAANAAYLVVALNVPNAAKALDAAYKAVEKQYPTLPCLFLSSDAEASKCSVFAAVPGDLSQKLNAGAWCKAVLEVLGGKGGGKANLAQGSGPNVDKAGDAAAVAEEFATLKLST